MFDPQVEQELERHYKNFDDTILTPEQIVERRISTIFLNLAGSDTKFNIYEAESFMRKAWNIYLKEGDHS